MVGINPLFTHHMPEIWPDPDAFDPMRFTDEAQRNRHRFAWVPFGGGAHMCLGLHFAYMQAKCFARHFLQNLNVSLEPGYTPDWQMWPIPKPRDGLRVMLKSGWPRDRISNFLADSFPSREPAPTSLENTLRRVLGWIMMAYPWPRGSETRGVAALLYD